MVYFITLCVDKYETFNGDKLQTKRTVTSIDKNEIDIILQALKNQYDVEKEYKSSAEVQCEKIQSIINKIERSMK